MLLWLTIIGTWIIDRVIKIAVQANFELYESLAVIPNFFHLTYVLNPGAAFGLLAGRTWIFVVTALIVLAGIIYAHFVLPKEERFLRIVMGMIGGGALGNLYDRVFVGKVVDYLDFKIWSYVFNFADSMIVVGVGLLLVLIYLNDRKEKAEESHEFSKGEADIE